ncbi:MAG: small ribosomal subunit Rsm22 family protein [Deltaproteobacteria bacterium]|nr:small ribosomal subunit Rsm22 family protein [Deltaproteobacteria bacterium]
MKSGSRGSRIHRGLIGEQALLGTPYLKDPELRRAYDAEIAPRTEVQLDRVLAAIPADFSPQRALDLGAGTGAAGRVLRNRYGKAIELVAVDRVAGPGIIVADVIKACPPNGVTGQFDLIVAAHLLCELKALDAVARARLVLAWCASLLLPGGRMVILEPALKETSRELLMVRDRLVSELWFVEAPCFLQGPCPALQRERDWCHDSAPWPGGRAPRADFSYLVLRQPGPAPTDGAKMRVTSDLIKEKGRMKIFACGASGRNAFVLQKRDRNDSNRAFEDLARGDVIQIDRTTESGDGLRLGPDSVVEMLRRHS